MSAYEQVFVAALVPTAELIGLVAGRFPGDVLQQADGTPTLVHRRTAIDFEAHDYEDDESGLPDLPLTRYPTLIQVRDLDRDPARQAWAARVVYDLLAPRGWPLALFHDMQRLVARTDAAP